MIPGADGGSLRLRAGEELPDSIERGARRKAGRRGPKSAATESATETYRLLHAGGKGEKARQELTARAARREARQAPPGARQKERPRCSREDSQPESAVR